MEISETGQLVYDRTYSRTKPDGTKETWPETVERVVDGNLALVDARYQLPNERQQLIEMMTEFKIIPAGRHLWASGVKNAQHLFNCWVSGWTEKPSDHFEFTFMRLMEGGGVGANYSNSFLSNYPMVQHYLNVDIVCDPEHRDYQTLNDAGVLSKTYDPDWPGAFVIEDSREGWAAALVDLIDTHYRPGPVHYNRVYDVSRVRPAGAKLKTFGGTASGPLALAQMLIEVCRILSNRAEGWDDDGNPGGNYWLTGLDAMEIDHAIASCVVAGGVRRSARMAMMHWADPEIERFINIKQESGSHWTTNISVVVDDAFWEYVSDDEDDEDLPRRALARKVLLALGEGAVRNGEPGMWDESLSNVGEPNRVVCTNPCGEITLEPWEPCNLGHVNLAAFVFEDGTPEIMGLYKAHELMTRFLIRATFSDVGDPKSREVLDRNRRIGVGHLGVASFIALRGEKYSNNPDEYWFSTELFYWSEEVDRAAQDFCHQLRIPVPVKKRTVAPTGTIAKMPGVSEGIHPIFSKYFIRRIRFSNVDPDQWERVQRFKIDGYTVEDDLYAASTSVVEIPTKDSLVQQVTDIYGPEAEDLVESAHDLTLEQLLAFQAMYQRYWADNAVSFTANVDPSAYTADDVADQLRRWAGQIKGSTLFPEKSFPQAPYQRITKQEYEAATAKDVADGVDEDCTTGSCPIR